MTLVAEARAAFRRLIPVRVTPNLPEAPPFIPQPIEPASAGQRVVLQGDISALLRKPNFDRVGLSFVQDRFVALLGGQHTSLTEQASNFIVDPKNNVAVRFFKDSYVEGPRFYGEPSFIAAQVAQVIPSWRITMGAEEMKKRWDTSLEFYIDERLFLYDQGPGIIFNTYKPDDLMLFRIGSHITGQEITGFEALGYWRPSHEWQKFSNPSWIQIQQFCQRALTLSRDPANLVSRN